MKNIINRNSQLSREYLADFITTYGCLSVEQFKALVRKSQFPKDKKTYDLIGTINGQSIDYTAHKIVQDEFKNSHRYEYDPDTQLIRACYVATPTSLKMVPISAFKERSAAWVHIALYDFVRDYDAKGEEFYQSILLIDKNVWYVSLVDPQKFSETNKCIEYWNAQSNHNVLFYTLLSGAGGNKNNFAALNDFDFSHVSNGLLIGIDYDKKEKKVIPTFSKIAKR